METINTSEDLLTDENIFTVTQVVYDSTVHESIPQTSYSNNQKIGVPARRAGSKKIVSKKKVSCPYCPLKLVSRSALTVHLRVHSGSKPYLCDICGAARKTKFGLKRHVRGHIRLYDCVCSCCKRMFRNLTSVRRHIRCVHKKNVTEIDHYRITDKFVDGKHMMYIKSVHNNTSYYRWFFVTDEFGNVERGDSTNDNALNA